MKKIYSNTALLLTAVIWGFAFVAQSVGMDYVGAFTFQSIRSLLGAATLVPFILLTDRRKRRAGTLKPMTAAGKKQLVKGGVACGVMLTVASLFQQIGIAYTTVGKAGFITSMYLILVPILGIFLHKRVPLKIWGCVAAAAVGLYFLSINRVIFPVQGGHADHYLRLLLCPAHPLCGSLCGHSGRGQALLYPALFLWRDLWCADGDI